VVLKEVDFSNIFWCAVCMAYMIICGRSRNPVMVKKEKGKAVPVTGRGGP
jgi:hypothetical protein